MGEINSLVFLAGEEDARLRRLIAGVEESGRECQCFPDLGAIDGSPEDSFSQVLVFSPPASTLISSENIHLLKAYVDNYLVVVLLDESASSAAVEYFRLGVADAWFDGMSQTELSESFARLQNISEAKYEGRVYSHELEKANAELQESLRMLKQDQMAGLEVQKSLMPESPLAFGEYEISHSVTPSLYLSGDFVGYNFVLGRYLLFYFADVSGHGASSAFITVLLRFMIGRVIRRHVTENDYTALNEAPAGLLEHVNNQILATGLGKHLTIVAGCLDTETSKLRYVVGAQLPKPILIVDGVAEYLPGKGKPVGIFEEASWQVEEVALPKRCALVLLSDGVFDLVPDKDLSDKEQTLLRFLAVSSDDIESLKQALSVDFIEDPRDDISMCLLTRGM
ncbi:serine/threonine-protein phosphatase [Porticoccaceae bacterium]|nr:serine/threonine-protein phosphatase [Porticoccaceae bacterium]